MTATGRALIKHFEYTGFIEFCFMVEEATGFAFLLECNPRPTQITTLGNYAGVDLCQALFAELNGGTDRPPSSLRIGTVVAIFPKNGAATRRASCCGPSITTSPGTIRTCSVC